MALDGTGVEPAMAALTGASGSFLDPDPEVIWQDHPIAANFHAVGWWRVVG